MMAARWNAFFALVITAAIGLAVAITVFTISYRSEVDYENHHLKNETDERTEAIEASVLRGIRQIDLLAAYYEASPRVDNVEIAAFLKSIWTAFPHWDAASALPIAMGWVDVSRDPDYSVMVTRSGSDGQIDLSPQLGAILDEAVTQQPPNVQTILRHGRADIGVFGSAAGHFLTALRPVFAKSPSGNWMLRGTVYAIIDVKEVLADTGLAAAAKPLLRAVFHDGASRHEFLDEVALYPLTEGKAYARFLLPEGSSVSFDRYRIELEYYVDRDWSYANQIPRKQVISRIARDAALIGAAVAIVAYVLALYFMQQNRRLRAATREAREAARAKADFLASMSHEIRTPMNGIFGMTELLSNTELTPQQRRYVDTVLYSAEGLLVIIDDILDLSKLEVGKMELDPIPTQFVECVDEVACLLAVKARHKNIEVNLRVMPNVPEQVLIDPIRFKQIVMNLLANAIKFTENGQIVVGIERVAARDETADEARVRISIEDSGIGIAEEHREKIFERFTQSDGSTTRQFGGSGLGLSICKQIVELMGGEIGVDSVLGKGSTFWFEIPMRLVTAAPYGLTSGCGLENSRIMVVDDNALSAELIRQILQSAEADVQVCTAGNEALAVLKAARQGGRPFDLVLIDYQMPAMMGDELARAIRAEPVLSATPLILVSAVKPMELDEAQAYGLFDGAVTKPFTPKLLIDVLCGKLREGDRQATRSAALPLVAQPVPAPVHQPRPIIASGSAARGARDAGPAAHPKFSNRRVLVAEDSVINQNYIAETLRRFGCDVSIAGNGEEAVRCARSGPYDIILMDCHMPVMDGYQATREIVRLQAEGKMPETPVIALTADVLAENKQRCKAAGMDDYLSKPIRQEVLSGLLERWFAKRAATPAPIRNVAPVAAGENGPPRDPAGPAARVADAAPDAADPAHMSIASDDAAPDRPSEQPVLLDRRLFREGQALFAEEFWTVIDRFMADLDQKIQKIEASLAEGRVDEIHLPIHSIKSSSRQLGAMRLGELAASIEGQLLPGAATDRAALRAALDELHTIVSATYDALNDERAA